MLTYELNDDSVDIGIEIDDRHFAVRSWDTWDKEVQVYLKGEEGAYRTMVIPLNVFQSFIHVMGYMLNDGLEVTEDDIAYENSKLAMG